MSIEERVAAALHTRFDQMMTQGDAYEAQAFLAALRSEGLEVVERNAPHDPTKPLRNTTNVIWEQAVPAGEPPQDHEHDYECLVCYEPAPPSSDAALRAALERAIALAHVLGPRPQHSDSNDWTACHAPVCEQALAAATGEEPGR